jgi:hypothetical protein
MSARRLGASSRRRRAGSRYPTAGWPSVWVWGMARTAWGLGQASFRFKTTRTVRARGLVTI